MAVELVGGALLSSFLQVAFDRLASRDILDYFHKRRLNETLVEKLNNMLLSINTLIDDAEEKQFNDQNVKAWLDKLKDAVYEAEDVLDEIDYEVSKCKMEAEIQTTVTRKVRNFFSTSIGSFDKDIESRMKQVLENLEFLENRKIALGLKQGSGGGVGSVRKFQTTSLVDEVGIYGRDDDKEIIIEWLLNDNHSSVISIVGMGGLGKTTLAQLVYNDQRVKDKFDLKAWVCISNDFDVLRATRTTFESITMSNDDTKDLNMLQIKLKEKLTGKKFLVVFDDVWNEDCILWEAFQAPFIHGAAGSKILITTHSDMVASATCSDEIYHLKQLSDVDGWLLFAKYAYGNKHRQTNLPIEEIGRKIVKKCNGLPLALKTIGSLLHTKLSHEEWNSILTSEIWNVSDSHNNILPALRLSYHYLPSHLRLVVCIIAQLESLKSMPEQMNILFPSLDYLKLEGCPEIGSFPNGGLPSKLRLLSIIYCPKLFAPRMEWGLRNHTSLDKICIILANEVVSLPEPGLLPPSLTSLYIGECCNLTKLDYTGLCHLSSLERLTIKDCPRLQCLPKEGLPTSLSHLEIKGNCPLLKKRCRKLKGKDWRRISHIPCVMIDDDIIT